MKQIGIVGAGFAGTMTTVHLVDKLNQACEIIIINEKKTFNTGITYNPYSAKQILNVVTHKMSAYPSGPDHFLDWTMSRPEVEGKDRNLVANAFLPRQLYGEYLHAIWASMTRKAETKNIKLTLIESLVTGLEINEASIELKLENGDKIWVDECLITTGNHIPGNPPIRNPKFYHNKRYFQNPWQLEAVTNVDSDLPILIIGNGLTMVDTVLGLLENGFKGTIYSVSPNGFNILPHRHSNLTYTKLIEELTDGATLLDIVRLVNKHRKALRAYGISAVPIVDSLRPHTQRIWKHFTEKEKALFMSRVRHLWGVARHRIPMHIHDRLQQMRIDGRLQIISGKILDMIESEGRVSVEYLAKKSHQTELLYVSRIINCTGPETDLMKISDSFLKDCLLKGMLTQDSLKLGINTDTNTFRILKPDGTPHQHLYTIGSNLKGELWESIAVNELRTQAVQISEILSRGIHEVEE